MESNNKKKIGVIGYWFATNYGGVASYYSLYCQLKKMGYDPFMIDTPYLATDKEGVDVFSRNFFKRMNVPIFSEYDLNSIDKLNSFADTFILGSDQVLTGFSARAFGKLFLMDFANETKKRIGVSLSCGGDKLELSDALYGFVKKNLDRFTDVSMREYSAVDLIKDKFGMKTDLLIDPIFFTSAEEYANIGRLSGLPEEKTPYVASYILDPNPDKKNAVEKITNTLGMDTKIILDGRKFTHDKNFALMDMPDKTLKELLFTEWLHYMQNASFVFTDSFHGAAMSIILNKPFIMYANYQRGYPRFVTLVKMFDVGGRMITKSDELKDTVIRAEIKYGSINAKMNKMLEYAHKWIGGALAKPAKSFEISPEEQHERLIQEKTQQLYSNPEFIRIRLLATLLRDYGVKHIVLSPGGRDVPLVRMFEYNDKTFVIHQVTDERSAAYYGLGIAAQLRQPVACVCTSGTAASNYLPAVTEAYYTGVPLIVITADRKDIYHEQGEDQTIPQKNIYNGVVKKSVTLPEGSGYMAEYQAKRDISDCILETTHNGFGPTHINIAIDNISMGADLPREKWALLPHISPLILRVGVNDGKDQLMKWVESLKRSQKILIVYGQNPPPTPKQKANIEKFASKYNCLIVTDHIANLNCAYNLKTYNMLNAITQKQFNEELAPDILISVGGKSLMNDPLTFKVRSGPKNIRHWSVIPGGRIKDFYFRLTSVLDMAQDFFFEWFAEHAGDICNNGVYYNKWKTLVDKYGAPVYNKFDALYIQSKLVPAIPDRSILHLGVGQSFFFTRRFKLKENVEVFCNMGTNGIDGCTSTFMGQCSVVKDRLCFLLVGDLSFFYDMNSIWNKNPDKNVRILMVNNNGTDLLRGHRLRAISSVHNTEARGWVESTGFKYMEAHTKEEYEDKLRYFVSNESDKPLFFEVFCE